MKFLVDEDLPTAVVALLTDLGHEAIHVRDAGLGGQPDRQIFATAQDTSAILLTSDIGFGNTLLYPSGTHLRNRSRAISLSLSPGQYPSVDPELSHNR